MGATPEGRRGTAVEEDVRQLAARAIHDAIRQAIDDEGPAADRAWLAVTYVQEALASEGLEVVRKYEPPRTGLGK